MATNTSPTTSSTDRCTTATATATSTATANKMANDPNAGPLEQNIQSIVDEIVKDVANNCKPAKHRVSTTLSMIFPSYDALGMEDPEKFKSNLDSIIDSVTKYKKWEWEKRVFLSSSLSLPIFTLYHPLDMSISDAQVFIDSISQKNSKTLSKDKFAGHHWYLPHI